MATSQELVSTWLVFVAAAAGTIWLGLVIGSLIRPRHPTPEKLRPYECGEEPVGDARVQYDVRIYVAALVFLIFDVEIALLYPAGMILGKINAWRRSELLEEGSRLRLQVRRQKKQPLPPPIVVGKIYT